MKNQFKIDRGVPAEILLLTNPAYVARMTRQGSPKGPAALELLQLIAIFDRKPMLGTCAVTFCERQATRFSLISGLVSVRNLCDVCYPCQLGAKRGAVETVKTYRDAVRYCLSYFQGPDYAYELRGLIGELARAKGLSPGAGEAKLKAFFDA